VTTTHARLMPLILQLGRASAATMDIVGALGTVCTSVSDTIGVAGAVILLGGPPPGVPALTASDGSTAWLGEVQQEAGMGPLPAALRTGRPMLTADLTRIGPPALAAAAAECGLVSSLALPIDHDGERLGAVQLFGDARRPVEAADGEASRALFDVLAARLIDVWALGAVAGQPRTKPSPTPRMPSPRSPSDVDDVANTCEVTTRSLPAVTPRTAPTTSAASSSTTPRSFAPQLASPQVPHTS
jgi:hypothetical protein